MAQIEQFNSASRLRACSERVKEYVHGENIYPVTLEIDPTNDCPLNCTTCVWGEFRSEQRNFIPQNTLMRLVGEATDIGVKSIIWTGGGEPLVNPGTLLAVEEATKRGLKSGMFTCGDPMPKETSDFLLDHLSWVRFHVDGATPESYVYWGYI